MAIMLYKMFEQQHPAEKELGYSEFLTMVDNKQIAGVVIQGEELFVTSVDNDRFRVYAPQDSELISTLRNKGVSIKAKPLDDTPWFVSVLVSWFPMILLIGFWIFFMRQMQSGGDKALSFGKSRAQMLSDQTEESHL